MRYSLCTALEITSPETYALSFVLCIRSAACFLWSHEVGTAFRKCVSTLKRGPAEKYNTGFVRFANSKNKGKLE